MNKFILTIFLIPLLSCSAVQEVTAPVKEAANRVASKVNTAKGYFDFDYDEASGKLFLSVDKLDTEFLYVNSLAKVCRVCCASRGTQFLR